MPNRPGSSSRSGNMNLDGSIFGTMLPHMFLKHFSTAVVHPPKIYHYKPKIFGFQVFGRCGSKYHTPTIGGVRFTEENDPSQASQLVQKFKSKFTL